MIWMSIWQDFEDIPWDLDWVLRRCGLVVLRFGKRLARFEWDHMRFRLPSHEIWLEFSRQMCEFSLDFDWVLKRFGLISHEILLEISWEVCEISQDFDWDLTRFGLSSGEIRMRSYDIWTEFSQELNWDLGRSRLRSYKISVEISRDVCEISWDWSEDG